MSATAAATPTDVRPSSHRIVLYSCLYGTAEAFNPVAFGAHLGALPCFVFSDNANLAVPEGVTLVLDPLFGLDPHRASRRAKLMPERYLPACEWSVYIDNKLRLSADVARLIDGLARVDDRSLFVVRHPTRNCLFEEGLVCIDRHKDSSEKITAQLQHYQANGFPRNAGLHHGGFLVRRHGDDTLRRFGECWYEHVLAYSRRDQISFQFVARELGLEPCYLAQDFDEKPLFEMKEKNRAEWRSFMFPAKKRSFWSQYIKPNLPWRR